MFQESPALFALQLSAGPLPFEQFAQGFGEFGQAEIGKIVNSFLNKPEIGRRKHPPRKVETGKCHTSPPHVPFLP